MPGEGNDTVLARNDEGSGGMSVILSETMSILQQQIYKHMQLLKNPHRPIGKLQMALALWLYLEIKSILSQQSATLASLSSSPLQFPI